jgi:hypothetical protein
LSEGFSDVPLGQVRAVGEGATVGMRNIVGETMGVSVDTGARVGISVAMADGVGVSVGPEPKITGPRLHAGVRNARAIKNRLILMVITCRSMYHGVYPLSPG